MSSKQDRVASRTAEDVERKYNFGKTFAEVFGLAEDARKAAEKAQEVAENANGAVESLDAEEIFNRLTNNGVVQGIYRTEDGNVYINASYIVSGVLTSKDGKTFYLDLENGVLKGAFEEFSVSGKTVDTIAQEKADTALSSAKTYADSAASNAVSTQTQTDIFNKLTNNGNAKGIYIENGELYINAYYFFNKT